MKTPKVLRGKHGDKGEKNAKKNKAANSNNYVINKGPVSRGTVGVILRKRRQNNTDMGASTAASKGLMSLKEAENTPVTAG